MKRTPCKPGTIIGWYDFRATVVEDTGGRELVVKYNGRVLKWAWVYFVPCRVISVPRTRNNKLSTVFRNAALYHLYVGNFTSRHEYSCSAIRSAAKRAKLSTTQARKLYAKHFKPRDCEVNQSWFGLLLTPETQEHRYMCLLLMAEIVKDL